MVTFLIVLLVIVLLIAVGVVGLVLKLLWWVLVGLVIGALARLVLPGRRPIGWLGTIAAGIAGSIAGGILGDLLGGNGLLEFLLAVAVAALLIVALSGSRRELA